MKEKGMLFLLIVFTLLDIFLFWVRQVDCCAIGIFVLMFIIFGWADWIEKQG